MTDAWQALLSYLLRLGAWAYPKNPLGGSRTDLGIMARPLSRCQSATHAEQVGTSLLHYHYPALRKEVQRGLGGQD